MIYNKGMTTTTTRRRSKYTDAVRRSLTYFGHATNAQITDDLRRSYPHISDTTVHRITQRLYEDGEAGLAPNMFDGAMVYDSHTTQHDHFRCQDCDRLRDVVVPTACRKMMRLATGRCRLDGPLLIVGTCEACIER